MGGDDTDNLAIESLNLLAPQVIAKQTVDVEITIHNYGLAPQPAVPLTLLLGQRVLRSTTISVAARASAVTRFPIRLDDVGPRLVAKIESNGLKRCHTGDFGGCNQPCQCVAGRWRFAARHGQGRRGDRISHAGGLSCVGADAIQKIGREDADVAVVDLSRPNFFGYRQPQVSRGDTGQRGLAQFAAGPRVEQHVYGGGGLLIAPGRLTRVDNLNQMLYRDGAGICPAQFRRLLPPTARRQLPSWVWICNIPSFNFCMAVPILSRAVIGRYFPVTVQQGDAHVLASYANGKPFLLQGDYGRGHVLLVTSPLDADWNTLPSTNFYLPMVQLAVRYMAARPSRNIHPGELISADFDAPGEINITLPDGSHPQGYPHQTNQPASARCSQTLEPGVYLVTFTRRDDHARTQVPFVVMPSHEESDLTPLSSQQWNQLADRLKFTRVELDKTSLSSVVQQAAVRRELWPMLLTAVFMLALLESYLARRWTSPLQIASGFSAVTDAHSAQAVPE